MQVGLTLAQRPDDSTDVGPTLGQPILLSGIEPSWSQFWFAYGVNETINVRLMRQKLQMSVIKTRKYEPHGNYMIRIMTLDGRVF